MYKCISHIAYVQMYITYCICTNVYHILHMYVYCCIVCGCEYGCVVWCVWSRVLPHHCLSGSVQRLHRTQAQHTDLHRTHLLPEAEAHGGRQDPLPGQRTRAGADQTAHGGEIQVRTRGIVVSRDELFCVECVECVLL